MTKTYYNVFINSKNRQSSDSVSNFIVNFQTANISCKENEYLSINVVSFDMMNLMYNVNSITKNNTFNLTINNTDFKKIIPFGNYNVFTFADMLNSLLNGIINVSYNQAQNSYTFKKILNDGNNYYISPGNAKKLFGFADKTQIDTLGFTGGFVNMVNYNKIILRANNLNFDYFTFENFKDGGDNFVDNSDILFWISKQDIEPFKMISYNNIDGSKSFHYNLFNKDLDFIELKLTNEFNEEIMDAGEYLLSLQIIKNEKKMDMLLNTLLKTMNIINEIKVILLQGLKFLGFFNSISK